MTPGVEVDSIITDPGVLHVVHGADWDTGALLHGVENAGKLQRAAGRAGDDALHD